MHGKAVARERRLKETLSGVRTKLKELRQRLRERQARRSNKSEKRGQRATSGGSAAPAPRPRGQQPGSSGHGRRDHSALPAQVEHHELEPNARCCPKCGGEYGAAGSEDSEVLEIEVRAHRRVIKRQRYHCSCGCAGAPRVVTAPAPSRLIPKGILGVSIWVQVLLDKYRHHRPTYRLLEDLSTHGLQLAQGTVTDGLKRLAPLFAPLREALIGRNLLGDHWHADETGWYVFEATDQEAGQRWCLWVFWCREAVVFTLDRTRSARVPKEHFAGVAGGIVSVDRYSSYKRLAKDTPLELQYCWVHVRRDFIGVAEKWDEHREWGEQWLELIGELYHLNAVRLLVCNDPVEWAAADAALRAAVTAMAQRLERELAQPHLPQVRKKVLTSLRNHWSGLIRFVDQPAIPMDNNQAERALRGPVVGRKNYYGSGATWSGELTATLFSLFHTLELWQINPRTWLTEYLNACAAAGSRVPEDFERFLPWNRRDGQAPRASPALPAPPRAAPRRAA
jgi:transposase